jgi:hypothetical protein
MPKVSFTSALQRFLAAPSAEVGGGTVGEALAAVFASRPALRGYVLDDQGAVRRHVSIYVNGEPIADRARRKHKQRPRAQQYLLEPHYPR